MNKESLLIEEYKLTFENYKFTFQQSLNVSKFYITIISIFIVGFIFNFKENANDTDSLPRVNSSIVALLILILLGLFFSILQYTIIKKRRYLIKRMNYLRNKSFRMINAKKEIKEYNKIANFKKNINRKAYTMQISTIAPFAFAIVITVILFLYIKFK